MNRLEEEEILNLLKKFMSSDEDRKPILIRKIKEIIDESSSDGDDKLERINELIWEETFAGSYDTIIGKIKYEKFKELFETAQAEAQAQARALASELAGAASIRPASIVSRGKDDLAGKGKGSMGGVGLRGGRNKNIKKTKKSRKTKKSKRAKKSKRSKNKNNK